MTQNTQTTERRIAALTAELLQKEQQLAEARAVLATMNADRCEILREFGALQGREAKAARELAAARAEAERLRLPAEAWRTLEAYREAERNGTSEEAEDARWVHIHARDAARAAKEAKP